MGLFLIRLFFSHSQDYYTCISCVSYKSRRPDSLLLAMATLRPTRITAQAVERNVQMQRMLDVQRHELGLFAAENNKLLADANALSKIDIRRRQAHFQTCRSEQEYEERIREKQKQDRLQNRMALQNQTLATELDREVAEEERRAREIQRICEEAPELRELERALKIAYLNKERAAQYEEKVLLAQREQERIQSIEDQMEYDRQYSLKSEADKQGAKRAMYEDQRLVLQRQMREKQAQLEEARRQTERDREMVDEIVRRINAEDEADMRKRREMQAATAKMVRDYELQRQRELAAAKAKAKAEEDAIADYQRSMAERGAGVAAKKQAKKDEEDRILAKIVEETERKRREEEEFNNLRDMLWEEELEAKRAQDAQNRRDHQARMKREMMEANEQMLAAKVILRKQDAENEARMIALMRKKFAEDEAREKAAEDARRASKEKHMVLIEQQRQQRKSMYDQEKADELAFAQEAARREEYRKKVIQEARKRLIEEHAARLQGFMPRVFANAEEFDTYQQSVSK